jgi:type I restriction enzyme M protein
LKADFILANPPFNDSDWKGELLRDDARWKFGVPPVGNANFAWIQHFIHHLSPSGIAGFVMANGSMSSNTSGEGEIRKNIIEADLIDCIIALPSQLFYNTMIPACLWFIARNKRNHKYRDRSGETLFIDLRSFGTMVDRRHKILTDKDIQSIALTYHSWRAGKAYFDQPGYCKSVVLDEIRKNNFIITPARYVGTEELIIDEKTFQTTINELVLELESQFQESNMLEINIKTFLRRLGFGQ